MVVVGANISFAHRVNGRQKEKKEAKNIRKSAHHLMVLSIGVTTCNKKKKKDILGEREVRACHYIFDGSLKERKHKNNKKKTKMSANQCII